MTLWTVKYRPQSLSAVLGNKKAQREVTAWLKTWSKSSPAMLLYGPPGIGKRTLLELIAAECRLELQALDIDNSFLKDIVTQQQLSGKQRALVLHNADCSGSLAALTQVMSFAKLPIILLAQDRYAPPLKSIQQHCVLISMVRPTVVQLEQHLAKICKAEGFELDEQQLKAVACSQDIRQALNQLQLSDEAGIPDTNVTPFVAVHALLTKSGSCQSRLQLASNHSDMASLMVHENYTSGCVDIEEAAKSALWLSDTDLAQWHHQDMAAACCVGAAGQSTSGCFPKFPQILGKMSTTNKHRRMLVQQRHIQHTVWDITTMLGLLASSGKTGQQAAARLATSYNLSREGIEDLLSLTAIHGKKPILKGPAKAGLTRALTSR